MDPVGLVVYHHLVRRLFARAHLVGRINGVLAALEIPDAEEAAALGAVQS